MTTKDIDQFVQSRIEAAGAIPEQIDFEGYEYATCTSVNDEICHGFPSSKEILKDGDLVKVDTVVNYNGAMADSCWSYIVGNRFGDIGHAIQTYVEGEGLDGVREFIGHGIGPTMHESPSVPHHGEAGKGVRLKEGMTITIEPMVNTGTWKSKMDDNGWTTRTKDGGISCQFEHTIAITVEGPKVLTEQKKAIN